MNNSSEEGRFFQNGRTCVVSRQHVCVRVECEQSLQRQLQLVFTTHESDRQRRLASLEVRSADTSAQEGVSGKEHVAEEEATTALGVSRRVEALALW